MRMIAFAAALLLAGPACAADASDLNTRLEAMAAKGNAEARYFLGMNALVGSGVPIDRQRALDHFRKAAAAGDPLAAYKLGCFYDGQYDLLPRDAGQALTHKLVAARAGYALAQQDVARHYADQGDHAAALDWLAKAAAQGTRDAIMAYASVHNGAPGFKRDAAVTDAYFNMFMRMTGGSAEQRTWLETFEKGMSAADRDRAKSIVASYRPQPTALTVKAVSGQRAAEILVAK